MVALLVFPKYEDPEKQQLIDTGLMPMPKPFDTLDVEGHVKSITAMLLKHDFQVVQLKDSIRTRTLKDHISQAIKSQPEVLMLIFCGHGAPSNSTNLQINQQPTLLLSGGDRVCLNKLDGWLCNFSGTLIQLFNACSSAPREPMPAAPLIEDSWAADGESLPPAMSCRRIAFFSSPFGKQQSTQHGANVFEAFLEAVGRPYIDLQKEWPGGIAGSWDPQPFCRADGPYSGTFPGPAKSASIEEQMHAFRRQP
jgi:hypothetical protein